MTWIETVPYGRAAGRLRAIYDRIATPDGRIDNILQVHGLRPHTLQGHMTLYKAVLHHSGNTLAERLLESIGVHVSLLNHCGYCVEHHFAGLRRLLGNDDVAADLRAALEADEPERALSPREAAAIRYAGKLTRSPQAMTQADVEALRAHGFDDGEILEINQVTSYFAYANRTVLGLGVTTHGDILGLSPDNAQDPDDWKHG